MFLKPKIAVKESNVEVWDYKLLNGRQLLSPSELLFSIRKLTPLWCSDQELPAFLFFVSSSKNTFLPGKRSG